MVNRFEYFNPNPRARVRKNGKPYAWTRCDCSVRAVSCALNTDWKTAYASLCVSGAQIFDLPDTKEAIDNLLKINAFVYVKMKRPKKGDKRMTVYELAKKSELTNTTIVANCTGHVVCIKNGKYYDTGDSGGMCVFSYWEKLV